MGVVNFFSVHKFHAAGIYNYDIVTFYFILIDRSMLSFTRVSRGGPGVPTPVVRPGFRLRTPVNKKSGAAPSSTDDS